MNFIKIFLQTKVGFVIAFTLIAVGALGGVGFLGFELGENYPQTIVVRGVSNIESLATSTADFSTFWEGWQLMKDQYLRGADIKDKNLVYGAIDGMVRSAGDPYTIFFPPTESKKFEQDVAGNFGGIGAEIGIKENQLTVIAPIKGGPAEIAGLRAQDKIFKIGDKTTDHIKVDDAVTLIRGEIGTKVVLTIFRDGLEKPKEISITRATIQIPTIDYKMLNGNVGYIRIKSFNENAPKLFFEAAKDLLNQGVAGMIIDLRDDPGGFLEVAVNLTGWFIEKGSTVAIEESRLGPKQTFQAYGNAIFKPVPIIALVNGGTASASEIMAGALRDNLGSKLVGEKTFGKGTVQELKRLHDGSSIKLTIAHWLTPNGTLIDKEGLKPDYEVKLTEENIKANKDPQLDKALEVVKSLIAKNVASK